MQIERTKNENGETKYFTMRVHAKELTATGIAPDLHRLPFSWSVFNRTNRNQMQISY